MALANSNKVSSICATIKSNAGMIMGRWAERTFAFLSSSPAAAMVLSGTIVENHHRSGFDQQNVSSSEIGDRVSFFVITGDQIDDVYQGYRQLTGITHMLPRAVYGYIQSKAIYPTQEQTP